MQKAYIQFGVLLGAVVLLSFVSTRLWGGKSEGSLDAQSLALEEVMTVAQFGQRNELPRPLLKKVFGLQTPADLQQPVTAFGMSSDQVLRKTEGFLALRAEHASKNWKKIVAKFALWLGALATMGVMLARGKVTAKNRKWLLLGAVAVFGVGLGADPSPMGTVKDAIVLFGSKGVVFGPRLIAFGVFLLMVIVANKFICAWGCQLGTLQDAIFRLNRDRDDRRARWRQFKVPFALSNGMRVAFFGSIVAGAFIWSTDIVEGIDPFKIFKPQTLGLLGAAFIGATLLASLFVYRPWCHFFCPFGLAGWVGEKISLWRIRVDRDKCTACGACEKACPSTVMGAILKRKRVLPDCFSCGTCIETCPVGAVSFSASRRKRAPGTDARVGQRQDDAYGGSTADVITRLRGS